MKKACNSQTAVAPVDEVSSCFSCGEPHGYATCARCGKTFCRKCLCVDDEHCMDCARLLDDEEPEVPLEKQPQWWKDN